MSDPGAEFRALHVKGRPFVMANAWDGGSARMLAALGARAIATSSSAHAFTLGLRDGGSISRDAALAHAQDLVAATGLPVSGDFEDGFGPDPDTCAETVRLAGEAGLAGICIEDIRGGWGDAYAFDLSVERIRAAAAAARALPRDFVFVARADGVLTGSYDMAEALRRIRAFDAAGADGLYVPMPPSLDDLQAVIDATHKPVNVLAAGPFAKVPLATYARMGAARISLGSALMRATQKVILDAGRAMFDAGDFSALAEAAPFEIVDPMLRDGDPKTT